MSCYLEEGCKVRPVKISYANIPYDPFVNKIFEGTPRIKPISTRADGAAGMAAEPFLACGKVKKH